MKNTSQRAIDLNKSFSHSVARYRRRKVHRAFGKGVTSNFTSWKIIKIRLRQAWNWIRNWINSHKK